MERSKFHIDWYIIITVKYHTVLLNEQSDRPHRLASLLFMHCFNVYTLCACYKSVINSLATCGHRVPLVLALVACSLTHAAGTTWYPLVSNIKQELHIISHHTSDRMSALKFHTKNKCSLLSGM